MQSTNKPYILFVDDEDMTRKTFERIAGKEFEVLTADSVASAKTLLDIHAEEVGVLLSDQRMPGQLGVELLEYCREHYPWIVRMLTTAYSDLADAIAAVNRGEIIRYIEKPWTNIDALLIDLRVAMRFHMLERENKQLLDEKLSAGAAISRLDRVRSLIDIAASQPAYSQPLISVESMLRDLAGLDCVQNPLKARVLEEMEMFGQPVSDTLSAIGVASGLGELATIGSAGSWQEIMDTCQRAGATCDISSGVEPDEKTASLLAKMAAGICTAMATDATRMKISVADRDAEGWRLEFVHAEAGEQLVSDWISGVHLDEANLAMSGLLLSYLSAVELSIGVSLEIDGNALVKIVVEGPVEAQKDRGSDTQSTAEWVDDILLLYS